MEGREKRGGRRGEGEEGREKRGGRRGEGEGFGGPCMDPGVNLLLYYWKFWYSLYKTVYNKK